MICCDGCEDWFHGKCVNITKAMGQQMEERGIEWRCPNCIKKAKPTLKSATKVSIVPTNYLELIRHISSDSYFKCKCVNKAFLSYIR